MKNKISIIVLSFMIICHLITIDALANSWKLLIKAIGQGEHVTNVVIGLDPNAKTYPVAPLMPKFAAQIKIMDPNGEMSEVLRPEDSERAVWNVDVTVGQMIFPFIGDPDSACVAEADDPNFFPILSWDSNNIDEIGADKFMELRLGGTNGTLLVDDMSTTTTYKTTESDALTTGHYSDSNDTARMRYAVVFKGPTETQEIPLSQGWNLISFQIDNCYYEGTSPTEGENSVFIPQGVILQDVGSLSEWLSNDANSPLRDEADPDKAGDWQRFTSFDSNGGHIMDKDLPPFINTLKYISAGYGYWIKMNAPGTLVLEGQFLSVSTPLELQYGWNLIGYIPNDTCYADIVQNDICPYNSGVYPPEEGIVYCPIDPFTPSVFTSIGGNYRRITSFNSCGGGMIYDTQLPATINTLHYVGPKYGYWIKIEDTEGAELIFPTSCAGI